jgi:hypothetical protein
MASGKGTLAELERLKAEYREKFKAEAPKVRRINRRCLDLLCPQAIGRVGLDRGGRLRIKRVTCTNKRCPKEGK